MNLTEHCVLIKHLLNICAPRTIQTWQASQKTIFWKSKSWNFPRFRLLKVEKSELSAFSTFESRKVGTFRVFDFWKSKSRNFPRFRLLKVEKSELSAFSTFESRKVGTFRVFDFWKSKSRNFPRFRLLKLFDFFERWRVGAFQAFNLKFTILLKKMVIKATTSFWNKSLVCNFCIKTTFKIWLTS